MPASPTTSLAAGSALLVLAGSFAAEAACSRQVINRTPHVVMVSQDGGPAFAVRPYGRHRIRYDHAGQVAVSAMCRAPGRPAMDAMQRAVAFSATYAIVAVQDRCWVDIGRGGTQPLALNNPRQGDIVVAPYGLPCP